MLEPVRRDVVRFVQDRWCERREVSLDRGLVLARRRDDRRAGDPAAVIELVVVEQQTARRLGRPRRDARARRQVRPGGRCRIGVEDVDGLGDGVDQLDRAGRDAPVGFGAIWSASPMRSSAARASGCRRSPVSVMRAAGPRRYGTRSAMRAWSACDPGPVLLECLLPVGRREVETVGQTIRPSLNWYSSGCRNETKRSLRSNAGPRRRPPGRPSPVPVERTLEVGAQILELGAGGNPREAADPDADRVDRPAAEDRHDPVAGLLEGQTALDRRPVSAASSTASRSRGSPARGGDRRGARGSRSTRRSRAAGAARARRVDPDAARCSNACTADIW